MNLQPTKSMCPYAPYAKKPLVDAMCPGVPKPRYQHVVDVLHVSIYGVPFV